VRPWTIALLLAGCGFTGKDGASATPPVLAANDAWTYDVVVADDLSRFDVTLAFRDAPPERLILGEARGLPFVGNAKIVVGATSRPLAREGDSFVLGDVGPGAAISYRADVSSLVEAGIATRIGRSVAAVPGTWLLRPMPLPDDASATLRLHLPAGANVTTPWTRRADGSWRLDETTFRWRGFFAVGAMETHAIDAGGRLDVAVLDRQRLATWSGLERWLTAAARAQSSLWRGFPVPRAQIVVKSSSSNHAVPFGETHRGGGPAVVLLIGDEATDPQFVDDWTAVHEFAHLGMPAFDERDAWLSEGFITYYQEVLRARAAFHDERAAWQEIVSGFARGRRGRRRPAGEPEPTLAEACASMSKSHAYLRVYWGGAAIALRMDADLRRASNGATSLDDAMREIRRAFSARGVEARADDVMSHLDAWLGRPYFVETANSLLATRGVPPVEETLARLGVVVESDRVVRLDDAAPDAAIRRAIMSAN